MEKEFIPYKQALALKELGFDKKCFLVVSYVGKLYFCNGDYAMYETNKGKYKNIKYEHDMPEKYVDIKIPTFSQAFRWFREKYGDYLLYSFGVIPHFTIIQNLIIEDSKTTYEEAELACLKKLIEIVKRK